MNRYLTTILSAIALIGYFLFVISFAVNMPNADDFDMLLNSVLEFSKGNLKVIFLPHGEHLIVTTRLAGIIQYLLIGEINFRSLVIIGNLVVPIAAGLLVLFSPIISPIIVSSMLIFLIHPQYYQSILWASGVLQHLAIMPFALGAFLFVSKRDLKYIILSFLLATIAFLTQGNGVFCFLLCGAWLFYQRKHFTSSLFLGAGILGCIYHLSRSIPGDKSFGFDQHLLYITGFLGAPFTSNFKIGIVLGSLSLLWLLFLTISKRRFLFTLHLVPFFVILTAIANSISRIHFGVEYGFSETRYCYPSLFYWASLIILTIYQFDKRKKSLSFGFLSLAICLSISSFSKHWSEGRLRLETMNGSGIRWLIARQGLEYPVQERAISLLDQAISKKIFNPPKYDLEKHKIKLVEDYLPANTIRIRYNIEHFLCADPYIYFSGYSSKRFAKLFLHNNSSTLSLPLNKQYRPDAIRSLKNERAAGFSAIFEAKNLHSSKYTLFLGTEDEEIVSTNRSFEVKENKILCAH